MAHIDLKELFGLSGEWVPGGGVYRAFRWLRDFKELSGGSEESQMSFRGLLKGSHGSQQVFKGVQGRGLSRSCSHCPSGHLQGTTAPINALRCNYWTLEDFTAVGKLAGM